ncbi:NAD(P)/FAD-dependent oxidoreductase [Spirosoma arcticum]
MKTVAVDVVIVGGSYAGLSAAMALGRAIRTVLIIDSGRPCNWQTPHSHNLITQDGATPAHITALAKKQVLAYPTVSFQTDTVTAVTGASNAFEVQTASGKTIGAKKILFATGLKDNLPAIEGFAACWGISVIHCPYCHGYEYRDQPTGILVNGPMALEMGTLIRNWTKELTIFTNGTPTFSAEQQQQLQSQSIAVVTKDIRQIVHKEGVIEHLVFADGTQHHLRALYARLPFEQHSPLPKALHCNLTEAGLIQTDEFYHTSVAGVYAAGDNRSLIRSVAGAIAAGNVAGALMNRELIAEGV